MSVESRFFFFQAEDGIRDWSVTGVQTCALPIWVRLGLVLSEIGQRNEIKVTDEEVRRAIMQRAQQYPGQERKVVEFYKNNPNAQLELRAPIFEDKVVDFALELANVQEKPVTAEELFKVEGDDHDH